MPSALITGVTGQDGWYLRELLERLGYEVYGWRSDECDVTDPEQVRVAVQQAQPDEIYHLAAQSHVGDSEASAAETLRINVQGTENLLSSAQREVPHTRFFFASSCQVFGDARETPQRETTPFNPVNPYGVSKMEATLKVRAAREAGIAAQIDLTADADRVRIHVRDNGPGIASEQLGKLFIPFERLGRSAGSGVGLGLYLSRELARRMDGNLGVQSESDHGADFWLELPVAESQPHRASKAGAAMESIGPLDVLYIEDNPVNLRVMESMFSIMENVTFRGVDNAEAGILEAQRHIPDIILVDMHLGDTDGYHVLEELREVSSFRAVPIIAVSADAMADNIQNALAAGFSAYVSKPVQMDELVGCIKRLLS